MTIADGFNIAELVLQLSTTVVPSVQTLFAKHPAPTTPEEKTALSGAKAEAGLKMAQAGIVAALEIDPKDFGDPERALVKGVNDSLVAYYNAKGWPTQ